MLKTKTISNNKMNANNNVYIVITATGLNLPT